MKGVSKHQAGYTLIELLLVIAVMAAMTVGAIQVIQYRAQSARIGKTAQEAQQILEAALAYYADQQRWPDPISQPDTEAANTFVSQYIPNHNVETVFGTTYQWHSAAPTAPVWTLWVPMPESLALNNAKHFATRIAGRLPNATVECEAFPCQVRVEIPRPGSASIAQSGLSLVASGYCQPGDPNTNKHCVDRGYEDGMQVYEVHFTACAQGEPKVTASPNFYHYAPKKKTSQRMLADFEAKQVPYSCVIRDEATQDMSCKVEVLATLCGGSACVHKSIEGNGAIGLSYSVTCEAKALGTPVSSKTYRY